MEDELLLETQKSAIVALEKLLEQVRSGDITEFIGIVVVPSGDYRLVGGSCDDRHRLAGMLLELAMERLDQRQEN